MMQSEQGCGRGARKRSVRWDAWLRISSCRTQLFRGRSSQKFSREFAEIAVTNRVTVCNVFHAGDGNLHPNIPYNADNPDEAARVHKSMGEIMRACVDAGGSITGEHGVGLDKIGYIELIFSPDSLSAMCRLREVFDPDRRSNPGKVVSDSFVSGMARYPCGPGIMSNEN